MHPETVQYYSKLFLKNVKTLPQIPEQLHQATKFLAF